MFTLAARRLPRAAHRLYSLPAAVPMADEDPVVIHELTPENAAQATEIWAAGMDSCELSHRRAARRAPLHVRCCHRRARGVLGRGRAHRIRCPEAERSDRHGRRLQVSTPTRALLKPPAGHALLTDAPPPSGFDAETTGRWAPHATSGRHISVRIWLAASAPSSVPPRSWPTSSQKGIRILNDSMQVPLDAACLLALPQTIAPPPRSKEYLVNLQKSDDAQEQFEAAIETMWGPLGVPDDDPPGPSPSPFFLPQLVKISELTSFVGAIPNCSVPFTSSALWILNLQANLLRLSNNRSGGACQNVSQAGLPSQGARKRPRRRRGGLGTQDWGGSWAHGAKLGCADHRDGAKSASVRAKAA